MDSSKVWITLAAISGLSLALYFSRGAVQERTQIRALTPELERQPEVPSDMLQIQPVIRQRSAPLQSTASTQQATSVIQKKITPEDKVIKEAPTHLGELAPRRTRVRSSITQFEGDFRASNLRAEGVRASQERVRPIYQEDLVGELVPRERAAVEDEQDTLHRKETFGILEDIIRSRDGRGSDLDNSILVDCGPGNVRDFDNKDEVLTSSEDENECAGSDPIESLDASGEDDVMTVKETEPRSPEII